MTLRSLSGLNEGPNHRAMSVATITGSVALHRATTALQRLRSPRRLAVMVAAIVPTMTGSRARGPSPINTPGKKIRRADKNGNAIRFGQQEKTEARRQEIGDAQRKREACK